MNAVIFVEISISEKKQGHAIEDKLTKLREYCEANNFNIIKEFLVTESIGGLHTNKFHECLDFIAKYEGKVFLVTYDTRLDSDIIKTYFPQYPKDKSKIETRRVRHSVFIEPIFSQKIWRYISLAKFLDLLQSKKLFFTRMDKMRQFDRMEGRTLTKRQEREALNAIRKAKENGIEIDYNNEAVLALTLHSLSERYQLKELFVNCWHMNDNESFAMWKIYSDRFGVCLQSTYKRLRKSFRDQTRGLYKKNPIYIGKINYVDYNERGKNYGNLFDNTVFKRTEFKFENELRCVVWAGEHVKDDNGTVIDVISPENLTIVVDLNELIENVYISPSAPSYFQGIIKDLCNKYGVLREVIKSNI